MREVKSRKLQIQRMRRIRRCLFLALLLIVLCTTGIIYSKIVVEATPKQESSAGPYKYYTKIRVRRGDTLWNIANDYMDEGYDSIDDFIQEVREINSIPRNTIYYGQQILIPYYSDELK